MDLIDWTCDTCHALTHGSGAISITYDEIHRADAVRKAVGDPESADFTRLSVADALARPKLGLWKVECDSCAGECIGAYSIDLLKARTGGDLAEWSRHLSAKTWFAATNWDALVTSVSATQATREAGAAATT
jgi:hypothetical protein